jgi:hypothetical protein
MVLGLPLQIKGQGLLLHVPLISLLLFPGRAPFGVWVLNTPSRLCGWGITFASVPLTLGNPLTPE